MSAPAERDGLAGATAREGWRALLAGGGSGGHVFPALAVGEELAARGWRVDFTGAAAGMEARLVGERGLPFHPLPALPFVGRGLADRLRALWTLVRSTFAARRLIRGLGIAVVVGTGGYVSAPAVLGAALAGRPSLLLEPNAVPGTANRWLSRWASDAALAFDACAGRLHCGGAVTGVPVRAEFAALPDEPPRREPLRVLVAGGSQGAEQLNRLVPAALGRLAADGRLPALSVFHQAGRGKVESTEEAYRAAGIALRGPTGRAATGETAGGRSDAAATAGPAGSAVSQETASGRTGDAAAGGPAEPGPDVTVADFVADMASEVGAAHLVVSRAGAITAAEICNAGRASLLVPLTLAGGHQADNARTLEQAGAALVLPSTGLTGEALGEALGALLADRGRLAAMGRAARAMARPDAAAAIADRVERLAAREAGSRAGKETA